VTVDDPGTFNAPWSGRARWQKVNRPIIESICAENNLNYEKYSPVPSEARPAITFSGSQAGLLKSSLASASNQCREAVSTLFGLKPLGTALNRMLLRRYRLATFRIRLLQLRISTSFSDAWNHLGRWHSKPAAQRITPDNQA